MTTPDQSNLSDEDQAKLSSGDYVVDPVFGVQPKTPAIQRRDYEASLEAKDAPATPAAQPATVKTNTTARTDGTQPPA